MKSRLTVALCIVLAMLAGCASLGIFESAEHEFELGLGYFNRGQYDEAIPHFVKSTELDANYVNAYIYLGRSHLNMGRWVQALAPLRTAYRISPGQTRSEVMGILIDALLGAALGEFKKGNFSGSIDYLREGLRLDGGSSKLSSQLVGTLVAQGADLLAKGKVREAIASFSEAVELSPNHGDAYLGLAKAFFKNGDLLKAFNAAEKAFKLDPSSLEAESLMKRSRIRPEDFLLK